MPAAKKYKLLSKAGDAKPLCAFFLSEAGCRNGDKCTFLHGLAESSPRAVEVSETASVVSSESESGGKQRPAVASHDPFADAPALQVKNDLQIKKKAETQKGKKRKSRSDDDDLFASPKGSKDTPSKTPAKTPATKKVKASPSKPERSFAPKVAPEKTGSTSDFRNLVSKLPVASFSIPSPANAKVHHHTTPDSNLKLEVQSSIKSNSGHPLPNSTEQGRKWLESVKSSRLHERYDGSFDFAKYKAANNAGGITAEWIKSNKFGAWCSSNPQAIAIDCEMCETQDPLSGAKNAKALCRMSVVNAENPAEVLIDTLVKPSWPVTDYRTRINGISKEDLENVEFTLRHAQAFMMALCNEETVVIGHAVHNDLVALHMEHYCVADSAFLFHAKDSTSSSVSLKDLVMAIFQKEMPDTHDSVNDSRKALDCVRHWVEKGGNVEPVERTVKHKGDQLFVHRIPKECKSQHLVNMFVKHTSVEPSTVDAIEFSNDSGKTMVAFKSTRHANLAFDSLEGNADQDKSGRLQKKVYLRSGDYVRVRKMTHGRNSMSTPKTGGR